MFLPPKLPSLNVVFINITNMNTISVSVLMIVREKKGGNSRTDDRVPGAVGGKIYDIDRHPRCRVTSSVSKSGVSRYRFVGSLDIG